jgi:O-acetyl-ADP-ribose deacetylase (regulator of RNase III)
MKIKSLYYITHIDNLPSIFKRGILSHERIEAENGQFISMFKGKTDAKNNISKRRKVKPQNGGKNLLGYVNLLFQPRNPMMYRAMFETGEDKLAVLEIADTVLNEPGVIITDGNATDELTQFYPGIQGLKRLQQQGRIIQSEWWKISDGSKRKIMAECLVPDQVKPEHIRSVIIADDAMRNWVQGISNNSQFPVICQPDMFFQPKRRITIGKNISLIDGGDIFFSELQTLTVTVNLQKVMGKGLALRAKEQFPDVYVEYEKACRSKKIAVERPYIYKREASVAEELTDLKPHRVNIRNPMKWFLLFATKRDWRAKSRIEDIDAGLKWLQENCKEQGIQSLAMAALGCANGGLNWADVAPLMCKSLDGIGIPVEIYLPREYPIEPQHLVESHLLTR